MVCLESDVRKCYEEKSGFCHAIEIEHKQLVDVGESLYLRVRELMPYLHTMHLRAFKKLIPRCHWGLNWIFPSITSLITSEEVNSTFLIIVPDGNVNVFV